MSVQIRPWEQPLIALALDGLEAADHVLVALQNEAELVHAYRYCEDITAHHSKSFHMASRLLPPEQRRAARALYAFCRVSDDIIDDGGYDPAATLNAWRQRALSPHPSGDDPVALAWADTRARYRIPVRYAEQLIAGVARDLHQTRYATFSDLAEYCYGVASTVGLMTMHIIGYAGPEAIPYAVKLGVALQLTNILRDVGQDWRTGRLYLPEEELGAFDLGEEDLAAGRVDGRWRAFMRFQIARNRQLYAEAWPGIALLNPEGRFAIAAAAALYRGILGDIEDRDYDVFRHRAHLTTWEKLRKLPAIWWGARRVAAPDEVVRVTQLGI